ncbi:MAG: right-handed parallel beta-helix repeat-containing protein, partial [Planctomycetaceae bacterium]|nr:right-handed parallel beta-helix repeat-containing protein [Planctomycetaceae bacterium]
GASPDEIHFNIAGAGVHTITITGSALPVISDTVFIDARTQTGYTSSPLIELNGAGIAASGLTITANDSQLAGLSIFGFVGNGLSLVGDGNTVFGSYFGLRADETTVAANVNGLSVVGSGNTVRNNTIAGNSNAGIMVNGVGGSGNRITANFIGVNSGSTVKANAGNGITISGAAATVIGTGAAFQGNVIAGNAGYGIFVSNAADTVIQGNVVGTNSGGTIARANGLDGVRLDGAVDTIIGEPNGNPTGGGNAFSGNLGYGLAIVNGTSGTIVEGNSFGSDPGGTLTIANLTGGILIEDSANNTIGGATSASRNVISGNTGHGVEITGAAATGNLIAMNFVGVQSGGTVAAGNSGVGILINNGATNNTIGGTGTGNVVSGNGSDGIEVTNVGTSGNVIAGNFIGVDASGTAALGNGNHGIYVHGGSTGTIIGGGTAGAGNVISGNASYGISLGNTSSNTVQGNFIGTDITGNANLFNIGPGIKLSNGSSDNLIGGENSGEGNLIAYNTNDGIKVTDPTTLRNTFLRNIIHDNTGREIDLNDDGVTNNDSNDADTGPNDLQNFPVITTAGHTGSQIVVSGTLDTDSATTSYRVDFFGVPNSLEDVSGHGGGHGWLGTTTVITDGTGNATFTDVLLSTGGLTIGDQLTATATRIENPGQVGIDAFAAYGATSEFSSNAILVPQGLIVDTTSDVQDGDTSSITALYTDKGADGRISLREAILAANNTANGISPDEIHFSIPDALTAGVHRISVTSPLPEISEALVIDATTEPDFAGTPVVMLDGNNAVVADAITIGTNADGSTIRGLIIRDFTGFAILIVNGSDGNTIAGNWIGRMDGSGGDAGAGEQNTSAGIRVLGASNVIGGSSVSDRNVVSGNAGAGISVGAVATGTIIRGNFIGTDASGATAIPNGAAGGINDSGVATIIGGAGAGEGNLIAGNNGSGVVVATGSGSGHVILGNTFTGNNGLAIDIGGDGVTANDSEDVDAGSNDLLNFPVLNNVVQNGANLDIDFVVDVPAGNYRIEFFDNPGGLDGSGFGEGQTLIGFASITATGAVGYESFSTTLTSVTASSVNNITVTATVDAGGGVYGSTSEFGPQFAGAGVITVTTASDLADGDTSSLAALLGNRGADGLISLREALLAANNTANTYGIDRIHFDISTSDVGYVDPTPGAPGSGDEYWSITTGAALPDISDAVVLDATTQSGYVSSPVIELNGTSAGAVSGLHLIGGADGSVVRGFAINRFGVDGIRINSGARAITVAGNYLGTDVTGTMDLGNSGRGVLISGSDSNVIGGATAADRNVISGNAMDGVYIADAGSLINTVTGNFIGTDATGLLDLGNSGSGIRIQNGAAGNQIGGTTAAHRNIISGNTNAGIYILHGSSFANVVQGNYIGLNVTGDAAVSNGAFG